MRSGGAAARANVARDILHTAPGRAFELLPLPLKGAAGRATANKKHPVPPEVVDTSVSSPVFSPETLLANCTLAEMRQVCGFLKGMFK
jgi:hypothetical protein